MLHYSKIVLITPEGISIKRDNGSLELCCFAGCVQRYKERLIQTGEFQINDIESFRAQPSNCVGWRDVCAKPPYIEICTEPSLKIVFTKTAWWSLKDPFKEFCKLQQAIIRAGWTTIDLS